MACNEFGPGRMAEPPAIVAAIEALLVPRPARSPGRHALVTSGPTHEPIDPVRYLANRSSGRQGHAIAAALAALGARVTLVSGPVGVPDPPGVTVRHVETAQRDAGRLPGRAARRDRGLRRRGRRLAGGQRRRRQDQESARRRAAGAATGAQPRHPGHPRGARAAPAAPGGRLRRRDRRPAGQRPGQARAQGLRLDRGERRLAGDRHHGRRRRTRCT